MSTSLPTEGGGGLVEMDEVIKGATSDAISGHETLIRAPTKGNAPPLFVQIEIKFSLKMKHINKNNWPES